MNKNKLPENSETSFALLSPCSGEDIKIITEKKNNQMKKYRIEISEHVGKNNCCYINSYHQ